MKIAAIAKILISAKAHEIAFIQRRLGLCCVALSNK